MYWLVRGAQSALFYYTSCTPCIERARKRKIRAETKRERQALRLYQPTTLGEYHMQPEPFTTNPYWEADFACPNTPRPGRSQRRSRKHATSSVSKSAPPPATNDNSDSSRNTHKSPELRPQASMVESLTVSTSSTWDRRQNQREDDEVWGFEYTDGSFHTGPARPLSRSETARSMFSLHKPTSREYSASSSLLSPPSLHDAAQPHKIPSGPDAYSSSPYMADINDMAPPSVAFPDEYHIGNSWFRQPPADTDIMRNTSSLHTSPSTRSRPSTRGKDTNLIRQVSNRMLSAQLQSSDLLALPGPALSRSSTQRSTYRPHPTLDAPEEEVEAIPDILDDDYIPSRLLTATKTPSSLHSGKSLRRPSQAKDTVEHRGTGTSAGSTVVHNPPSYSSEDTSMDADLEDSDADSGIDIDLLPDPAITSPTPIVNPSQAKRQRPMRTTTAPSARQPTSSMHGKSYVVTTGPANTLTRPKTHQQISANQSGFRNSLGYRQHLENLFDFDTKLAGISVDADNEFLGEDDMDEEEDPRWTWTRARRWSADL